MISGSVVSSVAGRGGVGRAPAFVGGGEWDFSNLPSGWTTLATHDGSAVIPTGWAGPAPRDSTIDHEVVSVATPVGSQALRQHWAGVADGQSPDFIYHDFSTSQTKVYYGTIMRLSATWVWGTGFGCKWGTLMPEGAGGGWTNANPYYPNTDPDRVSTSWFWTDQAGRTSSNWMTAADPTVDGQYQSGSAAWQHITPTPIVNGTWFKKETLVEYDVGRVRMWLDGVLVADSLVQSGTTWDFPASYAAVQFQNGSTLGGSSGIALMDSDYYTDYASIILAGPP